MWLVTNLCFPDRAESKQQRNETASFGEIKFSFVVSCCDACLEPLDIISTCIDQNMNDKCFSFLENVKLRLKQSIVCVCYVTFPFDIL